ncbi:MAG: MoaD/ThiS family protein [Anaerolineae bacterium]|nr:MoaD/ThiS family protein [Anaerolineae bacterium]
MIRVQLPAQLCTLANVGHQVELEVAGPATVSTVLDALDASYPMLRGTIRDQVTAERRPFVRFFVSGEDISLESPTNPLPEEITSGEEVFKVIGAMAGG